MKSRALVTAAAAVMTAAFALTGCSGGAPKAEATKANEASKAEAGQETEKEKKDVTLNFAIPLAEEEWQVFREDVFKPFEEQTGIKINGIQMENKDMENKLDALKQAGKHEIDIFAPSTVYLPGIIDKELAEDLTGGIEIPDSIPENLYKEFQFDSKVQFVPLRPNVQTNYYYKDRFEKYGLEAPKTWDELLNVAKKLYEEEGVGRVAIQANAGSALTITSLEFIRSAGGDPLVLNDEGSVKAFTFLQELWPYLSPESKRADFNVINELLATESIYYGANWPYCATVVVKDGGKDQVVSYVGFEGPEGISKVTTTTVMGIVNGTPNKEEAVQFLEYLMSEEVQNTLFSKLGWAPARSDAFGEIEEWQKPFVEDVQEALQFAQSRPIVPYWSDVDKAINDAFKDIVIDGNKDVQGTLDKYHDQIEAAKAQKGE
ncbi:sugar ABC transporter substrate-binding protein [Lacrimispora sp.]|uniref:sugar ABC transporter substrate-binding protein n=1 Tax=Lacrimispora sp. TaxID=2719234 RepID=UPI002FDB00DA